jgi:hypothetical protein
MMHALFVATVLLGSDLAMNDGRETARLVHQLRPQSIWNDVKMQQYHSAAMFRQRVDSVRP